MTLLTRITASKIKVSIMEHLDLFYQLGVCIICVILLFVLRITHPHPFYNFIAFLIVKMLPLVLLALSIVKIFTYFGII